MGRTNVGSSGCEMFSFFFREISQLGVVGGWVGVRLGDGGVRGQASLFGADCTDLPFVAEAGSGVRVEAQVVGVRFAQFACRRVCRVRRDGSGGDLAGWGLHVLGRVV